MGVYRLPRVTSAIPIIPTQSREERGSRTVEGKDSSTSRLFSLLTEMREEIKRRHKEFREELRRRDETLVVENKRREENLAAVLH